MIDNLQDMEFLAGYVYRQQLTMIKHYQPEFGNRTPVIHTPPPTVGWMYT